jgi:hypothetical protein
MARAAATLRTEVEAAANFALDAGHPVPVRHSGLLAIPDVTVVEAHANGLPLTDFAAGVVRRSDGRSVWIL